MSAGHAAAPQPDANTLLYIARWLGRLARLTRYRQGRLSEDELADVTAERRDYAEILARTLPHGAFTTDSLEAVVTGLGASFYPAVEDIRRTVQAWWNEHRPRLAPPVESPDSALAGFSEDDHRWLAYFRKREAEGFAALRPGGPASSRVHVLRFIKSHSLNAWAAITGTPSTVQAPPDPAVAARVAASMANAFPSQRNPPADAPLPDVTLQGDALRRSRQARGLQVPEAPPPPLDPEPDLDGVAPW